MSTDSPREDIRLRILKACLGAGIVGLFVAECFQLLEKSEPYNKARIPITSVAARDLRNINWTMFDFPHPMFGNQVK